MSIFEPCEGGIYRIDNKCADEAAIANIRVKGMDTKQVPVTGFVLELSTNHQFLHTLDEFIYVFPFGDRVGELTLTGMAFLGGGRCLPNATGFCGVYGYYMSKRLGKNNYKPIEIQLGGCDPPLLGFLTGLRIETVRPELPMAQWALRFNVIIDSRGGSSPQLGGGEFRGPGGGINPG